MDKKKIFNNEDKKIIKSYKKENTFYLKILLILESILFLLFPCIIKLKIKFFPSHKKYSKEIIKKYKNVIPKYFERERFDEIKNLFSSVLLTDDNYFLNGLIRMFRPLKILEIGVFKGGSSAVILNAIKDIPGSFLFSCDINEYDYISGKDKVGYLVPKYFPHLMNKWKLFVGKTTSAFIEEIGNQIDFVLLDSAHVMPGEVLNLLEILPFLKENAIIVLDDINHPLTINRIKEKFYYPSNNLLFSTLRGKKILQNSDSTISILKNKMGAVILDINQNQYYYEYFYLLSSIWSYMPNRIDLFLVRKIIKKYYDKNCLTLFEESIQFNYYTLKKMQLLNKDLVLYTFNINEEQKKQNLKANKYKNNIK